MALDKKQYEQALEDYRLASAGWYMDAPTHVSMAKALQGMGRNKEAIDQCRLAEAMAPRLLTTKFACTKIRDAAANGDENNAKK